MRRSVLKEVRRMTDNKSRILLIDDDPVFRKEIGSFLRLHGYSVVGVDAGAKALRMLSDRSFDLVISEIRSSTMSGYGLMRELRIRGIEAEVIFLTAYGDWDSYVDLMNMGAFDYVNKSANKDEILGVVCQALEENPQQTPLHAQ